jgi:hypothetical protein
VNKTQKSGTISNKKQSLQEHTPKLHRDGPIQQAAFTGLLPDERKYTHINEDFFWRGLLKSNSSYNDSNTTPFKLPSKPTTNTMEAAVIATKISLPCPHPRYCFETNNIIYQKI